MENDSRDGMLTYWAGEAVGAKAIRSDATREELILRLAEYEATGYAPHEVAEAVKKTIPVFPRRLTEHAYTCAVCGALLLDGDAYCSRCGQRVLERAPAPDADVPKGG